MTATDLFMIVAYTVLSTIAILALLTLISAAHDSWKRDQEERS